jgi:hypothetical protein
MAFDEAVVYDLGEPPQPPTRQECLHHEGSIRGERTHNGTVDHLPHRQVMEGDRYWVGYRGFETPLAPREGRIWALDGKAFGGVMA